jgi:hypothetical protein
MEQGDVTNVTKRPPPDGILKTVWDKQRIKETIENVKKKIKGSGKIFVKMKNQARGIFSMQRSRFPDQQIALPCSRPSRERPWVTTAPQELSRPPLGRGSKRLPPSGCATATGGFTPSCSGRAGRSTTSGFIDSIAWKVCRCATSRPGAQVALQQSLNLQVER